MTARTLYADTLVSGAVSGSSNAFGAPDGTYTTDTGNTNWTARFGMANPPAGEVVNSTITVTVRARKETTQSGTPSLDSITIYNSTGASSTIATPGGVTSTTGVDYSGTVAASFFDGTDLTAVEVQVATTGTGGSPSTRASVQIDSISWSGDFYASQNYTQSPADTEGLTDTTDRTLGRIVSDTVSLTDPASVVSSYIRTLPETQNLTEQVTASSTFLRPLVDNAGTSDLVQVERLRDLSENASLTDTLQINTTFARNVSELLDAQDGVSIVNAQQSGLWIWDYSERIGV